eukprot:scaffold13047_cov32-Tisochrysis_lutea.AAC.1
MGKRNMNTRGAGILPLGVFQGSYAARALAAHLCIAGRQCDSHVQIRRCCHAGPFVKLHTTRRAIAEHFRCPFTNLPR